MVMLRFIVSPMHWVSPVLQAPFGLFTHTLPHSLFSSMRHYYYMRTLRFRKLRDGIKQMTHVATLLERNPTAW